MSTLSKLTVTRHESSILDRRLGCPDFSCENSCPSARGAGSASDSFPIKVLAPAKYRMLKCPAGGLAPETILLRLSTCGVSGWSGGVVTALDTSLAHLFVFFAWTRARRSPLPNRSVCLSATSIMRLRSSVELVKVSRGPKYIAIASLRRQRHLEKSIPSLNLIYD
jgi:hypothetical protein